MLPILDDMAGSMVSDLMCSGSASSGMAGMSAMWGVGEEGDDIGGEENSV